MRVLNAIVLDSSAIMALLYDEPGADLVAAAMTDQTKSLHISSINLCEVVTKLVQAEATKAKVALSIAPFASYLVDFDSTQAIRAAELSKWTRPHGLSLGDRSCLALASRLGATAWTTDAAWVKLDVGVRVELIRT